MMSSTQRACEVLIVGGGPAGLVLACLLAKAGVDVVVLERRTHPRHYSRAIGLHPPALEILNLLDLEEAVVAEGVRVHAGTAYSRGRRLGTLSFEHAWPERPFVLTLPQTRTEALLSQRLAQLAPEAFHPGWEVTDIFDPPPDPGGTTGQSGVLVTARSTTNTADRGTVVDRSWRADIVIGADGPHSLVRRIAGITTHSRVLAGNYVMGDFAQHSSGDMPRADPTAAIFLEPTGVIESFPLPGQMRRWVAHTGDTLVTESPRVLTELIAERTGESVDPKTSTMISAFQVRRRLALQMAAGRCVLIGDAAHEVSPIGGQGMTLGWLDAFELAPLLTTVLADQNSAPLQKLREFQTFQRTRLATARATAWQAELNMALGQPISVPAAVLRDAALKVVLTTRMRHRLARAFTMRQPLGGVELHIPR